MITVANSAEYFINEFTQEIYDQVLDHVDFKSLECSCGAKGSFVKIGCYPRFYKTATNKICIRIQRVMCKHLSLIHILEEIEDVFDYLKECPHLIVKGLMMMAPHIDSNDTAVYFKQTKELFDQLNCKYSEFEMTELSMGMSNDYHEALKYGATMIRVGSALFE